MKQMGYYPGCSLPGTAREYDESLRAIAPLAGLELIEVPDWNCCGATAAHSMDRDLSLSLPARILALAEREGLEEVLVPCAACFSRLAHTRHEIMHGDELRERISGIIGIPYNGSARPVNILEALSMAGIEGAGAGFERTVACYYGCLLVRPPKVAGFDRPEDPRSMDDILRKFGASTIEWPFKTECCGAGLSVSRTDIVAGLSARIVGDAVKRGAEAIIVACPMCHANLDMRRREINKHAGKKYAIPVLYITQAIGLALGIDRKKLGLHRHLVPVNMLKKTEPAAIDGSTSSSVQAEV